MSHVPFDDAAHKQAVRMLRLLTRQRLDQLSNQPEPVPNINYHERALEQCPIALTACHVTASSDIDSLEPQFELRDSIDVDLPIFLRLSLVKGEAFITFPADRKRIIKCHISDRNPLTFTLSPDKTAYRAQLTREQVALVARPLRLPSCYQHFADERLAPTGMALLKQLVKGTLTWAQARLLGQLIALKETAQKTLDTPWKQVENLLVVDVQRPLTAGASRGSGRVRINYAQQFTNEQDLLIYALDGPRQVLGTCWKEPPTTAPQVTLQIDQGEPQDLPGEWDADWHQFTLPVGFDRFGPDGQLSWTWQREQNTLALRWDTAPNPAQTGL